MATSQVLVEKVLLAIDAGQTPDEKVVRTTRHYNARGWNKADAYWGGYMARYIRTCGRPLGQCLTGPWVERARTMLRKYARQYCRQYAVVA
jgi:hypothetical protein